ncbi:MAG: NUDIX hydrolase [Lachnospiraceae bacterium]|nr:NUDIX hydrolase [Lachnospiraceae bacterium]
MEEYFDVYDERKQKTGRTMARKGYFLHEGEYCLIVLGIIQKPDGRFLITKRSADKRWAAGAWEVPGGGVRAGESSEDAVRREVKEETGLTVSSILLIDTYSNVDLKRGDNYFVDIYFIREEFDEKDVRIDPHEATGFQLASFDEIKALEDEGKFLHYSRIKTALEKAGELPFSDDC